MPLRTRGLIADARQLLLRLPIRVAWVRTASEAIARTTAGVLRAVRLPWRWWDGFLDGVPVAAGFTRDEVLRKLEDAVRRRCGEALPARRQSYDPDPEADTRLWERLRRGLN